MISRRSNDGPTVQRVYEKAARFNAKPCKRCGTPASMLAEVVKLDRPQPTHVLLSSGWEAARDVESGRLLEYSNGEIAAACAGCGKTRILRRVLGVKRADIPCSAKCLASYGPKCECSCGGRNHGGAHGVG